MLSQREFNPPPQLAQNRKHQLQQHLRGLLLPEQIHDQHRVVEKFNQPPQPLTFPWSPPQSRELCVFPTFPVSCTGKPLKRRVFVHYLRKFYILLCYVAFQVPIRFPGSQVDKIQLVNDFCILEWDGDVITKDYKMGALVVTGEVIANLGQGEHILNLLPHLLWFGDRQHIVCRNNLEQNTRQIVNSCLSTTWRESSKLYWFFSSPWSCSASGL